jgi:ElaB/YqjD/DUF883 family membrane-anchored ribosome-binding protein
MPRGRGRAYLGDMNTTDIAEKAQDLKEQAQERAQDWQETARHQVRKATSAANEYVQDNAWASIAIAAVVGCVAGFLMARASE